VFGADGKGGATVVGRVKMEEWPRLDLSGPFQRGRGEATSRRELLERHIQSSVQAGDDVPHYDAKRHRIRLRLQAAHVSKSLALRGFPARPGNLHSGSIGRQARAAIRTAFGEDDLNLRLTFLAVRVESKRAGFYSQIHLERPSLAVGGGHAGGCQLHRG
jgi:hypothetical protein